MSDRVLLAGEGRSLEIFGATLTVKAGVDGTHGGLSLLEGEFTPGGFAPIPHRHRAQEECFWVVDGEFEFRVNDVVTRGGPGTFVLAERGDLHGFRPVGDVRGRILILHTPGIDAFFVDLAELSRRGPPDPVTIRALMERWDMSF